MKYRTVFIVNVKKKVCNIFFFSFFARCIYFILFGIQHVIVHARYQSRGKF